VTYDAKIRFFIKILSIFFNRKNPIGSRFTYGIFYGFWLKKVENLIDYKSFQVVHLFNHISFRWPLANLKNDSVYIWGPVSGVEDIKINFINDKSFFSVNAAVFYALKLYKNIYLKKKKKIKNFAKKCNTIFAVTKEDYSFFSGINKNTIQQLDVFYKNITSTKQAKSYCNDSILKIMFVGRIDELKGLDIAINAISGISNIQLNIFGTGPLEKFYKKYCINEEINNVQFHGHVNKDKLHKEYQRNHLLLHTSIKEAGCSAVIEAMEFGLPVITHNAFGMSVSINDEVGWLIPYNNSDESISFIIDVIKQIKLNNSIIHTKSKNSLEHVKSLSITNFVEKIRSILMSK
jgi:glycosyltransferase involved in cell wall biosynthesis